MSKNTATETTEEKSNDTGSTSSVPVRELGATPELLLRIQRALNNENAEVTPAPDEKLKKGEKPIAVLTSLPLRGLYSLLGELNAEARLLIPKKAPRKGSEFLAIQEKIDVAGERVKTVRNLFWDGVVDLLGDEGPPSFSIKDGWQIVENTDDESLGVKANALISEAIGTLIERLREHGYEVLGGKVKEGGRSGGSFFNGLGGRG